MLQHKHILIVEDNEINRALLKSILEDEYSILEAENGQVALDVLKAHCNDIALILLDISMPVMDGYTFLSVMKKNPTYATIPVIVTTQSDSEADELLALSHGAADFVVKPYKPMIILHRVASIIRLRETAATINQIQYDRLTGLFSREFFCHSAREILQAHPGEKYDVICSNIENFKLFNDVFGITAGDAFLREVGALQRRFIGDRGIYGHLNADQFVCLIPSRPKYENKDFLKFMEAVNALPNGKNVSMKWGIYTTQDSETSIEQMCDRALLAARSIKGQYGKFFAVYDDKLRGELLRQQAVLDCMESALAEGQFFICLQPQYKISNGALVGAEALVRWKHPEWGIQSPAEFIPIFEKNGFITKLDQFVWERACAALREWDDRDYPTISVSVNVSRADMFNEDIVDFLLELLDRYQLDASRLHLEITESAYTEHTAQIIEIVNRLRALGFIVEMDDFGMGYSSLNMLNQLPIDILKLDMKFVQNESEKLAKNGILRFIMNLASMMGMSVIAEGVETREQVDRLLEIGCDYAQGYYFERPVVKEAFEKLLLEQTIEEKQGLKNPEIWGRTQFLVADEDAEYRESVKKALGSFYKLYEAVTLAEAEEIIREHGTELAGILLSTSLPGVETPNVPDSFLTEKRIWNVPILITGKSNPFLEERALESGAADYVHKPHSQKSLYRRVLRAVKLSSLQRREQLLRQEAFHDHLTGVLNRRGWEMAIDSIREEELPIALFLFDLDGLQQINVTLGHIEGDRVLQAFGKILRKNTRSTDVVARYGGDEFIVAMKRVDSERAAVQKGEEICGALKMLLEENELSGAVTAGVTVTRGRESMDNVVLRATDALYRAKTQNKGHVECAAKD